MVETETFLKEKCLRSDNGGEYIDGGFSEYCAAQGIRMEKTSTNRCVLTLIFQSSVYC